MAAGGIGHSSAAGSRRNSQIHSGKIAKSGMSPKTPLPPKRVRGGAMDSMTLFWELENFLSFGAWKPKFRSEFWISQFLFFGLISDLDLE